MAIQKNAPQFFRLILMNLLSTCFLKGNDSFSFPVASPNTFSILLSHPRFHIPYPVDETHGCIYSCNIMKLKGVGFKISMMYGSCTGP